MAEYRRVFRKFKEETRGVVGRGKKKGNFNVVRYREVTSHKKRSRLDASYRPMSRAVYIDYFTKKAPVDEILTESEAQLAWLRDRKNPDIEKALTIANDLHECERAMCALNIVRCMHLSLALLLAGDHQVLQPEDWGKR